MTTTYSPPDNATDPAADVMFVHVVPPADAVHVQAWEDYGTGRWSRPFTSTRHLAGHQQHVEIVGVQFQDGAVSRLVDIGVDAELTPVKARQLAAALIAAADEIERTIQEDTSMRSIPQWPSQHPLPATDATPARWPVANSESE